MFKKNNLKIHNADCMDMMKDYKDNYFDLAIVDPPYGVDINSSGTHFKKKYEVKNWDKNTPTDKYFEELIRISKNQIIWGGNYFLDRLGNCKCYIIWDKKISEDMSFAMCEMAWTSFKNGAKIYKKTAMQQNRTHPTQKPVSLYEWLLIRYANKEYKILDTHLGSGSSAIAAFYYGCKEFTGIELDKEYYNSSIKRIKEHTIQTKLL